MGSSFLSSLQPPYNFLSSTNSTLSSIYLLSCYHLFLFFAKEICTFLFSLLILCILNVPLLIFFLFSERGQFTQLNHMFHLHFHPTVRQYWYFQIGFDGCRHFSNKIVFFFMIFQVSFLFTKLFILLCFSAKLQCPCNLLSESQNCCCHRTREE